MVRPALGGLAQRVDLRLLDETRSGRKFYSMLASYAGHLKHGEAFKTWEEMWAKRPWLRVLLERQGWSVIERWSRRGMHRARTFHSQYWRLARSAGDDSLVFFQVGRFIEFYGPQRFLAVRNLGLHLTALRRAGYAFTAGFPKRLYAAYIIRAIREGFVVIVVREKPAWRNTSPLATRLPCNLLIPLGREPFLRAH